MSEFKKGDVVVFTNQELHYKEPQYYPPPGTKGKVLTVEKESGEEQLFVQWPEGATRFDGRWYCGFEDVVKEADGVENQ